MDAERNHAGNHVQKSGHHFTLNVKRRLKPSAQRVSDSCIRIYMDLTVSISQVVKSLLRRLRSSRSWRIARRTGMITSRPSSAGNAIGSMGRRLEMLRLIQRRVSISEMDICY